MSKGRYQRVRSRWSEKTGTRQEKLSATAISHVAGRRPSILHPAGALPAGLVAGNSPEPDLRLPGALLVGSAYSSPATPPCFYGGGAWPYSTGTSSREV